MSTQSVRIGWRPYVNVVTQVVNAVDADAQAFITAAGITNLTQVAAINTLVNDLKTYGLWTKMKALYPFVGGTAAQHRFNLKDPRTINAAFYLDFIGGWTHSSTGALPNGTTGYADTKFIISNVYTSTLTNLHLSYYSRTDSTTYEMIGVQDDVVSNSSQAYIISNKTTDVFSLLSGDSSRATSVTTTSKGMYIASRESLNSLKGYKNNTNVAQNTTNQAGYKANIPIFIGGFNYRNQYGVYTTDFSSKESAFASIGDGLTTTDATNFYTAVQKFQTTLGRQIGSPIVSDTDAQAFINAAGLTDLGQANAVNTLVTDLKSAGIWSKMKAIYPFVGGNATSHKFNLKDPRTINAAFYLDFIGGWTHSSTGALPNGTTGYADTFLTPSTSLSLDSTHISGYITTNNAVDAPILSSENTSTYGNGLYIWPKQVLFGYSVRINDNTSQSGGTNTDDIRGFHLATRTSSNIKKYIINTTQKFSVTTSSVGLNTSSIYIAKSRNNGNFFNNKISFNSIGDGLTDNEATAFYTAVQKYQTTLGRQVGTPVLAEGQTAGLLDTYSSAAVAYSLRKLRNGYYGFAIRVRRSSDNAEQDIAFKTDGTLDTTSLLAFVGSGNGFVTTWYDQSGNGYNAYQSTAINQPLIVSSGSLTTNGGKPAIRCAVSTGLLINQISLGTTNSMFAVIDWSGPNKEYFGSFGNSWAFYQVDGEYKASGAVGRTNAAFTTNRFLGTLLRVNTQLQYYQNSATLGSAFTINANNVFNLSNLIGEDYGYGFAGDQQEAIIYTSSMASSRTAIESNINSYYSIY